jgi:regulator of sigma E protease
VIKFWDPFTAAKVALGLGFIIFIHELGHFLAAKWCDVHVRTFSIGFGPAIPFCSYKYGETTYMLGVIPLGGYVAMVGEGTGESLPDADVDEEDSDPRSFKNKSVPQRMLIISAGVIMNVIFGMVCFVAAYMHGVKEEPAIVGATFSGGAAWRADVRDGDTIVRIGSRTNPTFKDLRPVVMSTDKGEKVPLVVLRDGKELTLEVEPIRDDGAFFPVLGVQVESRLIAYVPPKNVKEPSAVVKGSKAAAAGGFQPGDRLVSMTDPKNPAEVSPLTDVADYRRRLTLLAGQAVTIGVQRRDEPDNAPPTLIKVEPAYRANYGLRMQVGKVAAVRTGSPAEKAGIQAVSLDDGAEGRGDRIAAVGITDAAGKKTWLANGTRPPEAKPEDAVRPFDPVLLRRELLKWAAEQPEEKRKDLKVDVVVLRVSEPDHKEQRKLLTLDYDDRYRFERELLPQQNSPVSIDGLGLAYWISGVVDDVEPGSPAAAAGILPNDVFEAVRFPQNPKDKWSDFKPHQWAHVETLTQLPSYEFEVRVKRGDEVKEFSLKGVEDTRWPADDRGLLLQAESREQKADGFGDAVELGARRTVRFIREVYMNLYSMIRGRVSVKTMSGPLTIADVSYKIAGEDFWQFLIFLGVISVNLAVVNFLPVPVLDGGHFVFLVYEKITGRPLPERVFAALMYIGLAMILTLFVYVISRDILRLYF